MTPESFWICSRQGYRIIDELKAGLDLYLAEKGFSAVKEAQGLALDSGSETTDVLERDTVIFPKFDRERCIGCGRCVVSCDGGGHQAIHLNEARKPVLDGKNASAAISVCWFARNGRSAPAKNALKKMTASKQSKRRNNT